VCSWNPSWGGRLFTLTAQRGVKKKGLGEFDLSSARGFSRGGGEQGLIRVRDEERVFSCSLSSSKEKRKGGEKGEFMQPFFRKKKE